MPNIIGTAPNQVPTNADLGTMAFQDAALYQNINQSQTGFKNRIINGAMMIDQRNAGASVAVTDAYTLDRWEVREDTDGAITVQQVADAPTGFSFSQKITTTTADASLTGTQRVFTSQNIEGFNTADLMFGTASAQTVTVSFWVKSSLTGTFAGALQNSARSRSYVFNYTISAANTWEQKSVTIAGDTTGTWIGATNGLGLRVCFALGVGPDYTGSANSWQSAALWASSGAVSVIGTLNATWQITGVQLEKGSTATSFDYRPYGTELALCQRYCEIAIPVTSLYVFGSANNASQGAYWKVEKRAAPTVTTYGIGGYPNSSGYYDRDGVGNAAFNSISATVTGFKVGITSGYSGGCGYKAECEL